MSLAEGGVGSVQLPPAGLPPVLLVPPVPVLPPDPVAPPDVLAPPELAEAPPRPVAPPVFPPATLALLVDVSPLDPPLDPPVRPPVPTLPALAEVAVCTGELPIANPPVPDAGAPADPAPAEAGISV